MDKNSQLIRKLKIGHSSRSEAGFTLLELLVVIAIVGMLAGLFVTTFPASQRRARDARRRSDIKQYQTAFEVYANRFNGNYLAATGNPVSSCAALGLAAGSCPNDPQAPTRNYAFNSTTTQYVIWAQLENPTTPTTFFIVCSNGRVGEHTSASGPACPLP